jgi:hypothetical protein
VYFSESEETMEEQVKTSFSFPDSLWRKFKAKAAHEGMSLVSVLIQLVSGYVKGDIKLEPKEKLAA